MKCSIFGNLRLSSVAIDAEFVGGIELLGVLLVAVDAAKFRMSLVCRFPMASSHGLCANGTRGGYLLNVFVVGSHLCLSAACRRPQGIS